LSHSLLCTRSHAYREIKESALDMDDRKKLPKGSAFVEYERREEAEKAVAAMDGAQIDGNPVSVRFQAEPLARRDSPARRDDRECRTRALTSARARAHMHAHTRTNTRTHTHTHARTHTCLPSLLSHTYAQIRKQIPVHTHTNTHKHIHTHTHAHTHTHTHTLTNIYTHTYTHIYTHAHTELHTHTHTVTRTRCLLLTQNNMQ